MILATRALTIRTGSARFDLLVAIDQPRPGPTGGWFCGYAIDWPDGARTGEGWGVDAVQAIEMTFQRIGADLYVSAYHAGGHLSWDASPGGGYGFPVPANLADMLVGEDRATSRR